MSGTAGTSALHVCYYQKASEQLSLGVEFDTNFRMMESTATLGYQIEVPKADLVFKGENICTFLIPLNLGFYLPSLGLFSFQEWLIQTGL